MQSDEITLLAISISYVSSIFRAAGQLITFEIPSYNELHFIVKFPATLKKSEFSAAIVQYDAGIAVVTTTHIDDGCEVNVALNGVMATPGAWKPLKVCREAFSQTASKEPIQTP